MPRNLQKADRKVKRKLCDLQNGILQNAGMELNERLKVARERHFRTAKEAALSLGIPYGTYSGHESGSRGVKPEELAHYARRFKAPIEWLSFGIGTLDREMRSTLPVVGRVGAGAQIDLFGEQQAAEYESVEVKMQLPPGAIAFEVTGESMYPKYEDGDLVVCIEDGVPIESLPDGTEAAVRTEDGARYLKKVVRSDREGFFHLESHNAPVIRNVRLEWVSDVMAIIPRRKWRAMTAEDRQRLVHRVTKRK